MPIWGTALVMKLVLPLLVLAVAGWVVSFPVVNRGLVDLGRIPGPVWRVTGYTSRKNWRLAFVVGYLLGGWPGAIAVLVWRRSETRAVLRDEWKILIDERRARREIVLAHYEDEPDDVTPQP